jgi:hypothetical protein
VLRDVCREDLLVAEMVSRGHGAWKTARATIATNVLGGKLARPSSKESKTEDPVASSLPEEKEETEGLFIITLTNLVA